MLQTDHGSSRLADTFVRLVLSSGIGHLAAAYTVSRWLTRPTPSRPRFTPRDLGLPCEDLECRTVDGIRLVGWLVEPPRPRATVALFHGMRFNREQTLERIRLLAGHGFRCVAFDHRAHGESGGKRTSFGYFESRDVAAVAALIGQRWPGEPRAALGMSMGAAALCYAASLGLYWHAVILESCYHDIGTAFTSRLQLSYPPWLQRLTPAVEWITERRLKVHKPDLAPVAYVGRLAPTPVLIVTGTDDPHASPDEARRLYDHCRKPRELWLVPDAGHLDVLERGGPSYRERILTFFERRLAA